MAPSLFDRAKQDNLTDLEILHRLCDEERASRTKSAVDRRVKDAKFPELNTVDGFDLDFDPVRKKLRARYLALHDLTFLDKGINPLFIGIPASRSVLARPRQIASRQEPDGYRQHHGERVGQGSGTLELELLDEDAVEAGLAAHQIL